MRLAKLAAKAVRKPGPVTVYTGSEAQALIEG
jgi:hypothetical protein